MSADERKLRQRQSAEQENATELNQGNQQAQGLEFGTVDDLLRYDSEQNLPPLEVAQRLERSLEAEPHREHRPWYKKLFGG